MQQAELKEVQQESLRGHEADRGGQTELSSGMLPEQNLLPALLCLMVATSPQSAGVSLPPVILSA